MSLLDPPAIFNIKNNEKNIDFRKFCKGIYKKKKVKFLKETIWNSLCRNVAIALMCIIPYLKEDNHRFQMLEFQFALDKKYDPWLINIESEVKLNKKHWSEQVFNEELINSLREVIGCLIEETSVVPGLIKLEKEKADKLKLKNKSEIKKNLNFENIQNHIISRASEGIKISPSKSLKAKKTIGALSPQPK